MDKYTDEQLSAMAQALLKYKVNNPDIYSHFVSIMSSITHQHPQLIANKILEYSELDV